MNNQGSNFGPSLLQRLNPSLALLMKQSEETFSSLRVALPGIVIAFDPGPPARVSVQIATNEYCTEVTSELPLELASSAVQPVVLADVPVMMPGAGGWTFTFPIKAGDECLLIFSDAPIDVWLQNGGADNNPIAQRRHSLSDAIAIFGLRSKPRGLTDYSTTSAQLRNDAGTVVIDLSDDKITISAKKVDVDCQDATIKASGDVKLTGGTVKLGTELRNRDFLPHTHTSGTSGSPTGPVL